MISETRIKAFITQLTTTSGISVIRADQMFKKQNYPYCTYKVLSSNEESFFSNIVERSYNSNTEVVTKTTNQHNESTISINVFSDSHEEANTKIQAVYEALKSDAVRDVLRVNSMSVMLGLTNIQDRTIFLESNFEYRFGFDFILKANTTFTEQFNSIEKVAGNIEANTETRVINNTYEVNS